MGGTSVEAMEDFTGGVTEEFDLTKDLPPNLFRILTKALERESMMACSVNVSRTCDSQIILISKENAIIFAILCNF